MKLTRAFTLGALSALYFAPVAADLRNWSANAEIATTGSAADRVLWNLRPGVGMKWDPSLGRSSPWSLGLEGRLRGDTQAEFAATRSRFDARLDRGFLQWSGQQALVSIGWQKFTWGDSAFFDGVDVLNARDLTEPLYTDDELLKLAVPAISGEVLADNTVFQLVIIPQPRRSPVADEIATLRVENPKELTFAQEPEFALKAGGLLKSGWDINAYLASHLERIPQPFVSNVAGVPVIQLFEPRVFTLGLTATQSFGEGVLRSELAVHSNRALPDLGQRQGTATQQVVAHFTLDQTFFSDLLLTGEVWLEQWAEQSTETFKNRNALLGGQVRKPFWSKRIESSVGFLMSPLSAESLLQVTFAFHLFDNLRVDLEVYEVKMSKGHVLARRQLKDLVRSSVSLQF